eukprot:scaffold369_cov177-Ochromonas_danica.AAC.61
MSLDYLLLQGFEQPHVVQQYYVTVVIVYSKVKTLLRLRRSTGLTFDLSLGESDLSPSSSHKQSKFAFNISPR